MCIVTDSMRNGLIYKGAKSKFGITLMGKNYLVKEQKKDWNNVLSEYVASRFIQICGIPSQIPYYCNIGVNYAFFVRTLQLGMENSRSLAQ